VNIVITGPSGFIGGAVTERLLLRHTVRGLTSHPQKNRFGDRITPVSYDFRSPDRMAAAFQAADVFVNTYYIRFDYRGETFEHAVERTVVLLNCARRAGVRRVVHVSVSNADESSELRYYRNKGRIERLVRESGLEFAILRPALVFGPGDILLNNIAWFLRRTPVFGVFGNGSYRVQPIALDAFAALIVRAVEAAATGTVTAVAGPTDYTYLEMVRLIRAAIGSRAAIVSMPLRLALAGSSLAGLFVRDVVLTRDEALGLMREYLYSPDPLRAGRNLADWLQEDGVRATLGRRYASELGRRQIRGSLF
jgi:nucleoside-diphosphate-sugar epimerase